MASYFSQESEEEESRYKREAFTVIACKLCGISIEDDHFDWCSLATSPKGIRLESLCSYGHGAFWNAQRIKIVMRLAKQKPTRFRENVEYLASRVQMTPENFLTKMNPLEFCRKVLGLLPHQCRFIH